MKNVYNKAKLNLFTKQQQKIMSSVVYLKKLTELAKKRLLDKEWENAVEKCDLEMKNAARRGVNSAVCHAPAHVLNTIMEHYISLGFKTDLILENGEIKGFKVSWN